MPYTFTLTSTIPATPQEIYETWLDSIGHSEMTGAEAVMSDEVGAEISAWDGYISGRNLELVPGERIVQAWRTTRFSDDHEDSIISVTLESSEEGTLLTLVHSNVPDDQTSYEEEGWQSNYFEPMQAYFSGRSDSREDDEEEEAEEGRAEEVEEENEEESEDASEEEDEAEARDDDDEETGEEEDDDEAATSDEDEEETEEEEDEGETGDEDDEESEEEDDEAATSEKDEEEAEEEDEEDGEEDEDDEDEEAASPSRDRIFAESISLRRAPEIGRSEPETTDRVGKAPTQKRAPVRKQAEPPTETPTAKKTGDKKPSTKKTSAKKTSAKKSAAKKTKAKKGAAKKTAAKKTAAKKTAAKRTAPKKKAAKRAAAPKSRRKGAKSASWRGAKSGRGKRR